MKGKQSKEKSEEKEEKKGGVKKYLCALNNVKK